MYYTVYKITNKLNDKIYIGVHKTKDLDDGYMGSGIHLKRSQEKYGIENFEKEIMHIFDNSEDMYVKESELVNEEFLSRDDTYNIKLGGYGGFDYINEHCGNQGIRLNNVLSDEKRRLGNTKNAEKFEDSEYAYIFGKNISRKLKEYYKVNESPFKGKKHSDETKIKISEKNSNNQMGWKNSQYGTMWIYSTELKRSMKIKKEDYDEYASSGWSKGRKMKFT
ncbi:homing endonuclease [Vibrio phage Va1]|nr:homing endonuclease [Vibrio phage Va1]